MQADFIAKFILCRRTPRSGGPRARLRILRMIRVELDGSVEDDSSSEDRDAAELAAAAAAAAAVRRRAAVVVSALARAKVVSEEARQRRSRLPRCVGA